MYHAAVLTKPSAAASLYRSFAAVNVTMDKFESIPELEQYLKHLHITPDLQRDFGEGGPVLDLSSKMLQCQPSLTAPSSIVSNAEDIKGQTKRQGAPLLQKMTVLIRNLHCVPLDLMQNPGLRSGQS